MAQEFPTIIPSHIDTTKHFWSAFGHHKTEVSANCIVRFCKDRDDASIETLLHDVDTVALVLQEWKATLAAKFSHHESEKS